MSPLFLSAALWFALNLAVPQGPYFPVKTTKNQEGISGFEAEWYGESLKRMNELSFRDLAKNPDVEIYRFLVLPTWGNSIAVRVERHGKAFSLASRRLDGQAGYNPGKLTESQDIELDEVDSAKLSELVQHLNFFHMPTEGGPQGKDGEQWILEGLSQNKYHVVVRWSPTFAKDKKSDTSEFVALCKFLVDKSNLSKRPSNKGEKIL